MDVSMRLWLSRLLVLVAGCSQPLVAQFSPGDLSNAHAKLEGTQNCVQCHEVGKEISGAKCLTCHGEIKAGLDAKKGFHYMMSFKKCVACHKEHLGEDVRPTLFRRESFDHKETGFTLTGKHTAAKCEQCHTPSNIKSDMVLDIVKKTRRQTYLGLDASCVSCHADHHQTSVGSDCRSCHVTDGWKPARGFDHTKTDFRLEGKHTAVDCSKCHKAMKATTSIAPVLFFTTDFSDCTPCHASPHKQNFADRRCASCHSPESWQRVATTSFDHSMTGFRLKGKHTQVRCEQCHRSGAKVARSGKIAHEKCTDCHSDHHRGEFFARYQSDCIRCHTEDGFSPSSFSISDHSSSRFVLTGAHAATPCEQCHGAEVKKFHFQEMVCTTCHKDRHNGQLNSLMKDKSCSACHTTASWKKASFDHSQTPFSLEGKHASIACESCHKPIHGVVRYRGLDSACHSCHMDTHANQFASSGKTDCAVCHRPTGWRPLIFDHSTQSKFALTGAHARVECRNCHHEEEVAGKRFIRYKPTPTACESCHKEGRPSDG